MLLEVKNLEKRFVVKEGIFARNKTLGRAVNSVSFAIEEGETLGLVGESGSGKSTLGRLIMQLIKPTAGEVYFRGRELTKLSFGQMIKVRQSMQMIFQDTLDSLNKRMTVEQVIIEPLEINRSGTKKERIKRVDQLLELVGVKIEAKNRYPHEFSGGQRQRIGIARALALSPKLIIADEPVSALDVSIQAQILNLLKELQERLGIGYLFIAHDIHVIRFISHQIAVMYLGQIVEIKDSAKHTQPLHPYTQALYSSNPIPDPEKGNNFKAIEGEMPSIINPPTGCFFHPRCPQVMERCRQQTPTLKPVNQQSSQQVRCFLYD